MENVLRNHMKFLKLLFLLLLFAAPAFSQGYRYDNFVVKPLATGGLQAVSGALITVCTSAGTGTPCTPKVANIYSDEALTTPITGTGGAGTTNSDAFGNYGFYIAPGNYVVSITGSGISSSTVKLTLPCGAATGCTLGGPATFSNPCTVGGFIYVSTGGCYTTIPAAIASFSGGNCGTIYLPVGTFTTNFTINSSNACSNPSSQMIIQGSGRRSTILKPASNAAVITLDSTAAAIQSFTIRDVGFDNTSTGFLQPAILIQGANINDWHEFRRLRISGGFKNSINITGRTIWSVFDQISLEGDTDIALNVVETTAPFNFNKFSAFSVISAAGAEGALLSCTSTCGTPGSLLVDNYFDGLDIENGAGGGLVLNNTENTMVKNGYFETNAGIQLSATGTFARALNITGSYFNTSNNTVDISITASQISGEISGNFIANSGAGASTISIAGSNASFGMFVHGNFEPLSGTHTNTADGTGTFHASYYGAYAPTTISTTGSQTPAVGGINHLRYTNASPATITNFTGGDPGQNLVVFNDGSSTVAFTHANTNGPFMPNGVSISIVSGGFCEFFFEPNNARWVNTRCGAGQAIGDAFGANTLVFKSGSGAGTYTNTNTTYASVDTTNLCTVLTVPSGWKLMVTASGVLESVTAAVAQSVALVDAGTTCAGGGVTALTGTERTITPPAVATFDAPFQTQFIFTGDGAAHSFSLAAKTSVGADAWGIQNTSATVAPSMTFTLMPSN